MDEENKNGELPEAPPSQNSEAETNPPEPPQKQKKGKTSETHAEFSARYHAAKQKDFEKLAKEVEERSSRDSKKKKRIWWIKTILLIAMIVLSIAIMFTMTNYLAAEGTKSFGEMIRGISVPYLFLFIAIILVYMFLESMKYSYLLKISTGKWRLKNSIKTMYLGKYYDGITPFGTGGQPFQIYYLHKKQDIPVGVATAIPLVRFIVTTIVFCLVAIGLFIVTAQNQWLDGWGAGWDGTVVLVIAIISMAFNFLVPVVMVFVSLFPRFGKKMMVKIVGLLNKMRIVKHKYPTMKKYVYEVEEYRQSFKLIINNWYKLFPMIFICLLDTAIYLSLPFFAVLAIAGPNVTDNLLLLWMQTSCFTMISYYSSSLVPTPGNSGANEAISTLVFLALAGSINNIIGWVILLWRFANYYIYILSGIGINIFEIIRSAIRNRRAEKKEGTNS